MKDLNLIACLSSKKPEYKNIYTWEAIWKNTSEYILSSVSGYCSQKSTALLKNEQGQTTFYSELHLAFNSELKSSHKLMFEIDSNSCNIILLRLKRISQHHCYLTFDAEWWLILWDCSMNRTIIKYSKQEQKLHRHFMWILSGHEVPQRTKNIVIEIQSVSFQIKVFRHDTHSDLYSINVDQFLKKKDELYLNRLDIFSSTASLSQSHILNQHLIHLKQETLSKRVFTVVRCFWDVSTEIEYVYKEPLNKRKFDWELWKKKAKIMGQISHVSW